MQRALLEPTIDSNWLEGATRRDPVSHAYAFWDLRTAPDRTRFVTLRANGAIRAYLLVWLGDPALPVIHWVTETEDDRDLLGGFPKRPFVAVVPERVAPLLADAFGPLPTYPLLLMAGGEGVGLPSSASARRLGPTDTEELRHFAARRSEHLVTAYRTLDLNHERVWGSFDGRRLVATARAAVTLPNVWILTGIFTDPAHRRQGHGRAVTAAAGVEARAHDAMPALFVREDNPAAVRLYESLGFRTVGRRIWVDGGAHREP